MLFPLIFISCASKNNSILDLKEQIIYCDGISPEYFLLVMGKILEDGSCQILYPEDPEYEQADFVEIRVSPNLSYYAYEKNNEEEHMIKLNLFLKNEDKTLELNSVKAKKLDTEIHYKSENDEETVSIVIANMSKKMRPLKMNSNEIIGTWIDVKDSDSRRVYTFCEDGVLIDNNYIFDGFYDYKNFYKVLEDDIIVVQTVVTSLITESQCLYISAFYYDGKYLYDTFFPLQEISYDDKIIQILKEANPNYMIK